LPRCATIPPACAELRGAIRFLTSGMPFAGPAGIGRFDKTEDPMATTRDVAVLAGSLRRESFSRRMARALCAMAPETLACEIVEIGSLPLYDQDDDADPPPASAAFMARIRRADAMLFVTPEYNRSVPGVLKNAIDIASRPYGKSAWNGKPCAVVSVSPGAIGGFGANQHLRQSLVFLNMPVLQQPEAYVGGAGDLFDADGRITKDATRAFLQRFVAAFAAWVERNLMPLDAATVEALHAAPTGETRAAAGRAH
jgi:chromate reductase